MKQTTNMSRVIGEIQSIGRKINKEWFNSELDMDRVIWTVQSTPKAYGHFTPYKDMTNERMNKVLTELKEYGQMKKELDNQIKALQDECKLYMTEHELSELFNDDNSIVARYSEVISTKFDTTAFKKSEWAELYQEYSKKVTSMRFTLN